MFKFNIVALATQVWSLLWNGLVWAGALLVRELMKRLTILAAVTVLSAMFVTVDPSLSFAENIAKVYSVVVSEAKKAVGLFNG